MNDLSLSPISFLSGCCGAGAAALDMTEPPRAAVSDGPIADPAAFIRRDSEGLCHLDLMAENIHCADCIRKIERSLLSLPGVTAARVNLSLRRIAVCWREGEVAPVALVEAVTRLGYPAAPFDPGLLDETTKAADRELLRCLGVAGFAAGNIMLLSIAIWAGNAADMDSATRDLFHWVSALIALPAVAYAGRPFFRSAWSALRNRAMNMDVPISLGILLASGMSLLATMHGATHAYFDAATTLLFFLLCGRYLDRQARARARSAAEHLLALTAVGATLIEADGRRRAIPVRELLPGMRVAAAAGDRIPGDGIVASGCSELDNSLLTGETMPVTVASGDRVYAGALNRAAPLEIEITAAGDDSFLAGIARLMSVAEQGRARYVRLADRVARFYAPFVHLLAGATFLGWIFLSDVGLRGALMTAVAVLIITCPCALALAVPVVQVVATGQLLRRGVLVKTPDALEKLAAADTIVFDKTGTLTEGRPRLVNGAEIPVAALRQAGALARASRHPLAQALAAAAGEVASPATEIHEAPGAGLSGIVEGRPAKLGSRLFCGIAKEVGEAGGDDGAMEIWLAVDGEAPQRFVFADRPRADAAAVIAELKRQGYRLALLSGDRPAVVTRIAAELGIGDWRAACLPADKVAALEVLTQAGAKVLMVGDGLNDAPALAAGFVSMSPASAAEVSQTAADLLFQGQLLAPVSLALRTARLAGRLVKQNFALAILYNLGAVPIAIAGLATPLIAAVAMSSSSLLVTANAFRLWGLGSEAPKP
jgi:P-type Cu2+ transporter